MHCKRRMFLALLAGTALFAVLAGRLFWIQAFGEAVLSGRRIDLVQNSVAQREKGIVLDSGRGDFYDRHMRPLTGETIRALAVFPVRSGYGASEPQLDELCRILQISRDEWESFAKDMAEPKFWPGGGETNGNGKIPAALSERQAEQIRALHIPNVSVLDYKVRYPADAVARQLIGFIGENPQLIRERYAEQLASGNIALATPVGGAGLERSFDALLRGVGPTAISLFTDGYRRPLGGLSTRLVSPQNPFYPLKVVTTLDLDIQRRTEAILDRLHIQEGAAVVLDAANADVIAMASRPQYDPYDVHPDRNDWNNRALKALVPGSVFKTAVAAAALEAHVVTPDEMFECGGEWGKYGFSCWKKGGHGAIRFAEAFAESCNIVFATVMKRLTAEQLERTADRLGMIDPVGWEGTVLNDRNFRQFDAEEAGRVFTDRTPKDDEGALIQTAIGQRDVRMTPLQAANMIVTLLHGGEVVSPRAVKEVRYRDGRLMVTFPEQTRLSGKQGISRPTAKQLLQWMEETVQSGTGRALRSAAWRLAGKSGTAQVSTGARPTENHWFVGFGPADSPRYAVAVVVQNVPAGRSNQAIRVFYEMMNMLAATEPSQAR